MTRLVYIQDEDHGRKRYTKLYRPRSILDEIKEKDHESNDHHYSLQPQVASWYLIMCIAVNKVMIRVTDYESKAMYLVSLSPVRILDSEAIDSLSVVSYCQVSDCTHCPSLSNINPLGSPPRMAMIA
jgi:hypothetical protein